MKKVKVHTFRDHKGKTFKCLLIEDMSVAQLAVRDLVGRTLCELNFGAHSIYDGKDDKLWAGGNMRGVGVDVFNLIFKAIGRKEAVFMQKKGGICYERNCQWELVSTNEVDINYKDISKVFD